MNICRDELRKRKNAKTNVSLDEPIKEENGKDIASLIPDEYNLPERVAEENELRNRLELAIQKLPKDYKEPLVLRYTKGLSYEDISSILKLPIGTVKIRIHRARKMIREMLKGYLETY